VSSLTHPPARVIGIGASAGGVGALIQLLQALPADFPHALCVTLHVPATAPSALPQILDRRCALSVTAARHQARLGAGCVFVAPPDRHLVVVQGRIELTRGPKENGVRPAVDTMLRSIAASCGPRGVAVVLSGALGDGSNGARLVLQAGGAVFVQDPEEATVPSMPESTLALVDGGARVLPAADIGSALAELEPVDPDGEEADVAGPPSASASTRPKGAPTGFTCPECRGSIWQVREGRVTRYRCRIGHAYSEDAFIDAQGSAVEAALWSALEVLEERAELLRKVAERRGGSHAGLRAHLNAAAEDADGRAALIRRALAAGGPDPEADALSVEVASDD
jgi:two-component system, chemotaxis family, protein-glutamate methylesterase/glutaminase